MDGGGNGGAMCLILFAYNVHPDYRLVFAANRDEFYERPTRGLNYWKDVPQILAGRDLKARGTWLGVTPTGRLAAITNYREPHNIKAKAPSRGQLVTNYLVSDEKPGHYCERISADGHRYNGYNLILGDRDSLSYCSNRRAEILEIKSGYYGLSNHLLESPWPKVGKGKQQLQDLLEGSGKVEVELLFALLQDRHQPADNQLPDTGVGLEWERILAPLFIKSDIYGTRSSSIILIDRSDQVTFIERTFDPNPSATSKPTTRSFSFTIIKS